MPTPRTGSVEPHGDHFDIRVRLPSGKKGPRICLPKGLVREQAKEHAATHQRVYDETIDVGQTSPSIDGPTCDAWAESWFADREARGLTSVRDDRGRWKKWISPKIGGMPMRAVAVGIIEAIVESLDTAVAREVIAWKTALNVWILLGKAFDDATRAKTRALRVLETDPTDRVRGPDRGAVVALQYLSPAEFLRLVSCHDVPLLFRRACVLAVYFLCRAAELVPLAWDAIDLDANIAHFHVALDRKKNIKSTKGKKARRVPIEPTLRPLLTVLHQENCVGRILPIGDGNHLARGLRRWLKVAGVTRADLFITDATRRAIRFHDLRATGITWLAIRGLDPLKIMARSGHEDFKTMRGYLREAEVLSAAGTFGEVFPALPIDALTNVPERPGDRPKRRTTRVKKPQNEDPETGIGPATERANLHEFAADRIDGRTREIRSCTDVPAMIAPERPDGKRGDAIQALVALVGERVALNDIEGARRALDAIEQIRAVSRVSGEASKIAH